MVIAHKGTQTNWLRSETEREPVYETLKTKSQLQIMDDVMGMCLHHNHV
jgi:hypothetical protein